MKLYSYFRSSSAWRVRIALNHKGLAYDYVPIHLLRDGGEHHRPAFRALNPQGMVPVLEVEAGEQIHRLAQSLAILEYLEEVHPIPPLLPRDPLLRARVRQLAEIVNSSIQPYQTVLVLNKMVDEYGADRNAWAGDFITRGLFAFEVLARESSGEFAVGDQVTLADVCLIPQLFGARRFGVDLKAFPACLSIETACRILPAFAAAVPEAQPDAEA